MNRHDSTYLLLAQRCFVNTTVNVTNAMDRPFRILQENQGLVRSIMLELAAENMQDYDNIHPQNLKVALEELESGAPWSPDASPLTRANVPRVLDEDAYRKVVRRLLQAISAGNLREANKQKDLVASVPAMLYIAQAIRGDADRLTAALLVTIIIDTTHLYLWAEAGPSAKWIVDGHLKRIEKKIRTSITNHHLYTTCFALVDRDEAAAATSDTGIAPMQNLLSILSLPRLGNDQTLLQHLPCVVAHQLLVVYVACAETCVVFLNNCAVFAGVLFGYKLLRQLEVLATIPLLDKLVHVFGDEVFLYQGSSSKFASKWNAVLGGKPFGKKNKQENAPVKNFVKAPNRITRAPSFLLTYPCGGHLENADYLNTVMPSMLARTEEAVDKKNLQEHMQATHTPISVRICADLCAAWDDCSGAFPIGLLNYFEVYTVCVDTFAKFHQALEIIQITGRLPLPNRAIDKHDAAYSGLSAFSALLTKVDALLKRGDRESLVVKDAAVEALAGCYLAAWESMADHERLVLF